MKKLLLAAITALTLGACTSIQATEQTGVYLSGTKYSPSAGEYVPTGVSSKVWHMSDGTPILRVRGKNYDYGVIRPKSYTTIDAVLRTPSLYDDLSRKSANGIPSYEVGKGFVSYMDTEINISFNLAIADQYIEFIDTFLNRDTTVTEGKIGTAGAWTQFGAQAGKIKFVIDQRNGPEDLLLIQSCPLKACGRSGIRFNDEGAERLKLALQMHSQSPRN